MYEEIYMVTRFDQDCGAHFSIVSLHKGKRNAMEKIMRCKYENWEKWKDDRLVHGKLKVPVQPIFNEAEYWLITAWNLNV